VLENKGGKKINNIEISKKKIEIARSTIIHNEWMTIWLHDCLYIDIEFESKVVER
jgi:hypothetical protein